jgi:RND family efflux transporter MFP subunit
MIKITLIALISLVVFSGCFQDEKQNTTKKKEVILPVKTITVKNQNIPIWLEYTGKTQASSSQEVRARVAGILEEIYYKDGDYVKKGQKLFKIEQADYIAALETAKAKKRRNLAKLKLSQADVNRYKPLVEKGLAPRVTLEQYESQTETIKADIESNNAEIRQAQLELSYTIVKAPITGHASRRLVDIGNLVGKNDLTVLTTIKKNNPLYAYFSPSEEDFQKIQKYRDNDILPAYTMLNYQSPGLSTESKLGYVDFSNNAVDPETSTISMRATVPNENNKVLPGTFVYVNVFVTDRFKFAGVPPEVIFEDQRGKFVYIENEKQVTEKRYVTPLFETRYFTLLKKGSLKDGDKVIINALLRLKENIKVKSTDVTKQEGIAAVIKKNNLLPKFDKKIK